MSAATPITWTEHIADELHALAKHCGDAKQASRARVIAMIMEGASRTEAARAQGLELQILRDWVLRYNAEGFESLADRPRGGSEGRLTEAQLAEVGAWIEAGPDLERDAVTRWRVQDIVRKIEEQGSFFVRRRSMSTGVAANSGEGFVVEVPVSASRGLNPGRGLQFRTALQPLIATKLFLRSTPKRTRGGRGRSWRTSRNC